MNRRGYLTTLTAVAASVAAGCSSDSPSDDIGSDPKPESNDPTDTQSPTETDTQTVTSTPQQTQEIGVRSEPELNSHEIPERPSPDYTVDVNGDGDYETLAEAHQIVQNGDVLELGAGTYQAPYLEEITYLGQQNAETEIKITQEKYEGRNTSTLFNIRLTSEHDQWVFTSYADFRFYDCLVQTSMVHFRDIGVDWAIEEAVNTRFDGRLQPEIGKISGCEFRNEEDALNSAGPISSVNNNRFRDCVFRGPAGVFSDVESCRFEGPVNINNATAVDCLFTAGVNSGNASQFEHCRMEQHPEEDYAVKSNGNSITYCEVNGRLRSGMNKIETNVFTNPGNVKWFIQDPGDNPLHHRRIVRNAFIDADIQLNARETQVSADGVGNYYSAFKESDEDGDGILDLPRSIPGGGEHVDEYPLAQQNPLEYL